MDFLIQIHKNIFLWFYSFSHYKNLQKIIYIIAEKIDTYVIILAIIILAYFVFQSIEHASWKRLKYLTFEMVKILVAVVGSWGISYIIKNIVKAPRPFLRFSQEVTPLFYHGGFNSFPSGHATLFMALGMMIYFHHKKIGVSFIVFAILISITRIVAGVHFPIDIIVGWIIGAGISYGVYRLFLYKK